MFNYAPQELWIKPRVRYTVFMVVGLYRLRYQSGYAAFIKFDELAQIATTHQPQLIAIGAPLCLPLGLCCLEATCSCDFAIPARKGRLLELELSRMGISCFFTNKGSIIRTLIYRGIALSQQLRDLGFVWHATHTGARRLY